MIENGHLRSSSAPCYPCASSASIPLDSKLLELQIEALKPKAQEASRSFAASVNRSVQNGIDITAELLKMKKMFDSTRTFSLHPIGLLNKMRLHRSFAEKIDRFVDFGLAKRSLFDRKFLDEEISYLEEKKETMIGYYEESLAFAQKNGVDITNEASYVTRIVEHISSKPKNRLDKTFRLLRWIQVKSFYADVIYKRVSSEMIRERMLSDDLPYRVRIIEGQYRRWKKIAESFEVDIQEEVAEFEKIRGYFSDQTDPVLRQGEIFSTKITRGPFYCNRIIYKCCERLVHNTLKEAQVHPDLKSERKQNRIIECFHFLMKKLPPDTTFRPIEESEEDYEVIVHHIEKAKQALLP